MTGALIEPDATGTPMGACCLWAAAREWARFGLLYLHEGLWDVGVSSRQKGSLQPNPGASRRYVTVRRPTWLKVPPPYRIEPGRPQLLPRDAFHESATGGKLSPVITSHGLVVVRLGLALDPEAWERSVHPRSLAALDADGTP